MHRERFGIGDWWIAATLFAGNLLILGPWLLTDFSNQPWNNGYIYIAIARMFRDNSWGWNPLQYGGAPFHYLYPPLFHLVVGAMPVHSIARAFHLVTGAGYALTPVALYVLARQLFESRWLPAWAAAAYSVFPSPMYLEPQWRAFVAPWFHAPWGFVAMIVYEEAAHDFAFVLVLLAVAAVWRNRWLIASLLAGAVMLTNWPAMIGLALILGALAIAKTHELGYRRSAALIIGVAGAAYGLAAFWITPGYLVSSSLLNRVVLRHTLTASPFTQATWLIFLSALLLIGLALWRRIPARLALALAWVSLTGAVVVSTLTGAYLLPSPQRYILEFNAGLVLATATLISVMPRKIQGWMAAAFMLAASPMAISFARHAWALQPPRQDPRNEVSWQIAGWLNQHAGNSRIFAAGELDSILPLWSNVPQVGGSGQDISNFLVFAAERQVQYGCRADSERIAELWLRALDARYLVVDGAASREYFHWFAQPEKFASLPVAWDSGNGDKIYRVPDSEPHEAVIVDLGELNRLPRFESTEDTRFLEAYVRWAAGKRPAGVHWSGADHATLDADIGADEGVLVKINYDRGWRAVRSGTRRDPIGFLLIQPGQGQQTIKLSFGPAWDVWLGRGITAITILALVWMRGPRVTMAAIALVPAVIACAVLMSQEPPTVAIAEEAFIRLQPPLVNPGGIIDGTTNRPPPFERGKVIAIYGQNFGKPADTVRVRAGDRMAEVLYHGPNMVSFRMPPDAPANVAVSVEVNGCQGNEFTVTTQ